MRRLHRQQASKACLSLADASRWRLGNASRAPVQPLGGLLSSHLQWIRPVLPQQPHLPGYRTVSLLADFCAQSSWIKCAGLLITKSVVAQNELTLLKALVLFTFSQTLKRS